MWGWRDGSQYRMFFQRTRVQNPVATRQLTTTYNSSFRETGVLFWPSRALGRPVVHETPIHKESMQKNRMGPNPKLSKSLQEKMWTHKDTGEGASRSHMRSQ